MDLQPVFNLSPVQSQADDAYTAGRALGELLIQTPEYCAFLDALKALNSDQTIQKLSAEMRPHQNALQWGDDTDGEHMAEMARLELVMENLSAVKKYRQAERGVRGLFLGVDEMIRVCFI
jgi:cell fate (sporulation/competence/biofilm development) regulator YlbF (YheA/YmcA/DUF963 family)